MDLPTNRATLLMRLYKIRNADKYEAHKAVANAIERGRMHKASECERCGGFGPLSGHHHRGYSREHRHDVIWICGPCHRREHTSGDWRADSQPKEPVSAEELLLLLCPNPVGRPRVYS
jgi:hypothetical protein